MIGCLSVDAALILVQKKVAGNTGLSATEIS